ncbi:MAG TPA: hypothetical protein V6D09_13445 [Leptolyngbyaceae cyanobacterium]
MKRILTASVAVTKPLLTRLQINSSIPTLPAAVARFMKNHDRICYLAFCPTSDRR